MSRPAPCIRHGTSSNAPPSADGGAAMIAYLIVLLPAIAALVDLLYGGSGWY